MELKIKKENNHSLATYLNRMGDTYFAHSTITKNGKRKYFASRNIEGALAQLPEGLVFGENINGVVTIQKPKPMLVPKADLDLVRQRVSEFRHLVYYCVDVKKKDILIYEPMGLDSIERLSNLSSYSIIDKLKRSDEFCYQKRQSKGVEEIIRRQQYEKIMRFRYDKKDGSYRVERRCYLGNEDWLPLGTGTLEELLNKYLCHIGKESFFELN